MKLLIIGKSLPPIGGVSIHVERLQSELIRSGIPFAFYDLKYFKFTSYFSSIFRANLLHLHSSSTYLIFITSLLCWCLRKKLIVTFHGDIGRYDRFRSLFEVCSIYLCKLPIVLNEKSLGKAKKITKNAVLVSAFIPPEKVKIDKDLNEEICSFVEKYSFSFSTNAGDLAFDKTGDDIYSIFKLVDLFRSLDELCLVFSDPSGNYSKELERRKIVIPDNVKIITGPHDFISVLKLTSGMVRATTTDGDSLSVKEALYFKRSVIASDCVQRPPHVTLYKTGDMNDLKETIIKISKSVQVIETQVGNAADEILQIYERFRAKYED